jgi:class 3 adenylate cyclase/tetratricopeptide (TPR) repeat protein
MPHGAAGRRLAPAHRAKYHTPRPSPALFVSIDETSARRHLAAVWFADIVGYTELAARDELTALQRIERLQSLARDAAAECEGRIVKGLGDAVLAEFSSTEAAVRAALLLRDRYAGNVPGAESGDLRFGVHVGDVVAAPDGDLYGDGVNVAARLQHEGAPGEVLVSGDVWRQLRQRSEYRFTSRGERHLHGINEPIEVFAVGREDAAGTPAERASTGAGASGPASRIASLAHSVGGSRLALAVGALLVLAAGAAWIAGRSREAAPEATSSTAIAIMPFSVRGSGDVAYLAEGMASLLSTKLDRAGDLRAVDPRAVLGQVEEIGGELVDPADGHRIAQRFGARWYVMGDILEVGGRIRVDATLYDGRDGDRVEEGTAEGQVEEVFTLVDEVATQLLAGMSGGPAARVDRIAAVTTSSLPALKAYLEGQSALRNGDYEAAVDAFQRAVTEDSTFALGYYRLSIAAEWLLRADLSHEAAQRAFRYADRLSERDRALLDAFSAFRRGETDRAETLYRSLVGANPDDVEAWLYLGELLFHVNPVRGRSPIEAKEPFLRILEFESDNSGALVHLARLAAMERNLNEVDRLVRRYVELTPGADRLWPMRALQVFSHRDRAEQESLTRSLERVPGETLLLVLWDVAVWVRDLPEAERLAHLLTEPWRPAEERALGYVHLAHYLLAQGRWQEARDALLAAEGLDRARGLEYRALLSSLSFVPSSAEELRAIREELSRFDGASVPDAQNPETFFAAHNGLHPTIREYLLGLVSARLGEREAAETAARRTAGTSAPASLGSLPSDLALGIRAQTLRQAGRPEEALDALEQARFEVNYQPLIASAFIAMAYERFTRAELLDSLGREEEALDWYRNLTRSSSYETTYLPIVYVREAQILERRGDRAGAVRSYRAFLDLWRGADPEFQPLVDQARRAVAELEPAAR